MTTITWLHLSDLHLKSGAESEKFNQKTVLGALWNDIDNQVTEGLKPDFVVFSGDVAYHGKKDEYELACKHFFDPLLDTTCLSKDRLFVVPGNHDIDWATISPVDAAGMRGLLANRDQINQFLSIEQDRSYFFRKFRWYAEFIDTYFEGALTFNYTEYFYTRIIEMQDCKLAIIGLNSVWMSACVKDAQGEVLDLGNLLIGERQLEEALERTEKADLRIALLHHPVDWLHEIDRFYVQKRLDAECDFVLHGHWHIPQVNVRHSMAGQAVYIPAGAVYAHRDYPNGYNFVRVDLDSQQVKVYLRRYNDKGPKRPEWTKDIQSTGEDRDGQLEFSLFQDAPKAAFPAPSAVSKKVLLVEDKPEWQEAVQSILVLPDFDLQTATSYADAKSKLQAPFDLIVMNLCLVNESDYEGVALLDDLGENHIPCVVLTGSSIPMRGLFERYKVWEAFVKGTTFNRAEFLRVVREAIESYSRVQPS